MLFKANKEALNKIREAAIVFAGEQAVKFTEQKAKDIAENKNRALKEQMKVGYFEKYFFLRKQISKLKYRYFVF